ncbi:alanine racemase [Clostridium thermobutyricum]|uniref:Alanine racemase n=1 Tax=Clostridium thermobutyricum DSM 4928 TaxID=1121339 RepID=A0A1V4SZD7_9CLOT|nr:alanine racemase [Clostridium thermobutyricum]OPX49374.1 alanine racemase [Clostridium thermobutyricum DSM 4928]
MKNIRPVWAEVDLKAIENNIKEIKRVAKDKEIIAVVKADAYGHGALDVVPVLLKNGADRLAVAVITEAIELREAGINVPILILGYTPISFADDIINYDIEQTVFDLNYAKELSKAALRLGKKAKIHISLDTGMGRIGFIPNEESINAIEEISKLDGIEITGMFTHFSTADEADKNYTREQFEKYKWTVDQLEKRDINVGIKHVANSATIIDLEEYYYDAIRPGIILYGYYPSNEVNKEKIKIKPALTLKSHVIHLKEVKEGTYISYGRKYVTKGIEKIATLPIGYADGYTRLLSGKVKVIINNKLVPVVGRICMDQCMINVSELDSVKVGDEVILLGETENCKYNADDIAKEIDTISYEILCMIGKRVPRVYKINESIVSTRHYL